MQWTIENYHDLQVAIERLCAFFSERDIPEESAFDGRLVAHELLSNALQHAGGSATVRAEVADGCIHIAVQAERAFCPPKGSPPPLFAERGRGIFLVDAICEERTFEEGEIRVRVRIREK